MTLDQHLDLAAHLGELAADESVATPALYAAGAAHHGRLAQQCEDCGGTGTSNPGLCSWLACTACDQRGWIPRAEAK